MTRKRKKVQKYSSPEPGSSYLSTIWDTMPDFTPEPIKEQQQRVNEEMGGGRVIGTEYTGQKVAVRGPKGRDGLYYAERRLLEKSNKFKP